MTRKRLVVVAAVVALVALVAFWLHGRTDGTSSIASSSGSATPTKSASLSPPTRGGATTAQAPTTDATAWALDGEPIGPLRLEGQVIDLDGNGVGGAEVVLATAPPRTMKTESDGSFAFDKLVGRTYAIAARRGDQLGGPLNYLLVANGDPVVIRIGDGATVEVTVLDDARKPIAGAAVKPRDLTSRAGETDAMGKAKLVPVSPGWIAVEVTAPGYAPNSGVTTVGSSGSAGAIEVTLRRGFGVAGKVVDEAGAPIAHARVQAGGDDPWGQAPRDADGAVTDTEGHFAIAALAAGDLTLTAIDHDHAPAAQRVHLVPPSAANVTIVMRAGGAVAGKVVDSAKHPIAFATVRVATAGRQPWRAPPRQVSTDAKGTFEIRGLARTTVNVRASSDSAASALATVDLTAKSVLDLELVLDVTGTISGIVVDETGAPVAEIPVSAFPDVLGGANAQATGFATATTGGDGAFVLRGLADGDYRLVATRATLGGQAGAFGNKTTPAKVGQSNVRITVPSPGTLIGKISIDGGDKPSLATVQLGFGAPTPTTTGSFAIRDVATGAYDVSLHSLEFEELILRDVKIEPGKTTDLGTVKVVRGRTLVGKVIDSAGRPVGGARVKVGEQIFAAQGDDGGQLDQWDQLTNVRTATSDADGAFRVVGVPRKPTSAGADHPERGRSNAVAIPAGDSDPPAITLVTKAFGSISGVVTRKGHPVADVQVDENTAGGAGMATFAQTAEDGTFSLPRVAEGKHVIRVTEKKQMASKSASVTVDVVGGENHRVAIEIPVGDVSLAVAIHPVAGARVDSAQVFLFPKDFAPKTGGELIAGSSAGSMKFWFGPEKPLPEFDELVPGTYSICSIPITGDMNDQTFMQRVMENVATLRVYCKPVAVTPGPAKQLATQDLPAMQPLPT